MAVNSKDLSSFPLAIVLKAMNECKVKVNPTQPAKKQALEIIKDLSKQIPIKRAQMRIKIEFKTKAQMEAEEINLCKQI